MKRIMKVSLILLIFFVGVFIYAQSVGAEEETPFYWEYINVDIDVQENGDMLITETQKYVFTAKHTNERYRRVTLDKVNMIENPIAEEE